MNQNEQGMLYPFRLSASRMRQSAVQLRRQGQVLDALTLVRRAAEQDDTPSAWQALAAELRQMGNWESACTILARVLSREPHQPGAWIDMARCLQQLGADALAVDCAYHQLQENPWGAEGDGARAILAELELFPDAKEPRRTQRLIHRGMAAYQAGERELGERRIRRALRMTGDKAKLLVTTAMMCMLDMDFDGALHYLPRALRCDPENPRTLTALSTLYHQQGRPRLARGLLRQAGMHAESVLAEDGFLTAAWAQDAWPEMQEYLTARMKRQPYRIPLVIAKAAMCWEQGDGESARQLWKDVLAIDPENRQAAAMISASQEEPEKLLCMPGMIPRRERQRQAAELAAAKGIPLADMLAPASRTRRLLEGFITSHDGPERQLAIRLLEGRDEPDALILYLKELLCRPFLPMDVRQWALITLARMGCQEDLLIMAGNHYTFAACRPVGKERSGQPWRSFLPMLLLETRQYGQSPEIVEFAASLWRCMTVDERLDASGPGRLSWCKAMEILFLRMSGREEEAVHAALSAPVSARRISRVLRRLGRTLTDQLTMQEHPADAGETEIQP